MKNIHLFRHGLRFLWYHDPLPYGGSTEHQKRRIGRYLKSKIVPNMPETTWTLNYLSDMGLFKMLVKYQPEFHTCLIWQP